MPPRKINLTAHELTGIVIHHSHGGNHAVVIGSAFFLAFSCCSWHFIGSARQTCLLKETDGHPPSAAPRWVSFPTLITAASLLRTPGCSRAWSGLLSLKKSFCHSLYIRETMSSLVQAHLSYPCVHSRVEPGCSSCILTQHIVSVHTFIKTWIRLYV